MKHTLVKLASITLVMTSLSGIALANDKADVMTNAFIKAMSPDKNTVMAAAETPNRGVIGGDRIVAPLVPLTPVETPSTVPPVFSPMSTTPGTPAAPDAAAAVATTPAAPDPCAAYMADYSSYTVCQDRVMKYQRMKDAKTKRVESQAATEKKAVDDKAAKQAAFEAAVAAKDQKKKVISGPTEAELAATAAAIASAVAAATKSAATPATDATGTAVPTTPATPK